MGLTLQSTCGLVGFKNCEGIMEMDSLLALITEAGGKYYCIT